MRGVLPCTRSVITRDAAAAFHGGREGPPQMIAIRSPADPVMTVEM